MRKINCYCSLITTGCLLLLSVTELSAQTTLSGRVIDGQGAGLSRALLYLVNADCVAWSSSDGSFAFNNRVPAVGKHSPPMAAGLFRSRIAGNRLIIERTGKDAEIRVQIHDLTGRRCAVYAMRTGGTSLSVPLKEIIGPKHTGGTLLVSVTMDESGSTLIWNGLGVGGRSAYTRYDRRETAETVAQVVDTLLIKRIGFAPLRVPVTDYNASELSLTMLRPTDFPEKSAAVWSQTSKHDTLIFDMSNVEMTYCQDDSLVKTSLEDALYNSDIYASHINRFSVSDTVLSILETVILDNQMIFWMFSMAGITLEDDNGVIMTKSKTTYRRIGSGSGLDGMWAAEEAMSWRQFEGFGQSDKDTLAKYLGSDTAINLPPWQTFLKFSGGSVSGTIDASPVDLFTDIWNGLYTFNPDSSNRTLFAVNIKRLDDRTVQLIGNYNEETVTMSFGDTTFSLAGIIQYRSSTIGNQPWTYYDMPESCPVQEDPGWFDRFLSENRKPSIQDLPPHRDGLDKRISVRAVFPTVKKVNFRSVVPGN